MISAKRPNDLANLAATHRAVAKVIADGNLEAVHDISDGGLAIAAAEKCIASGLGMTVGADLFMNDRAFAEGPGRYLVELGDGLTSDDLRSRLADVADVTDVGLVQHLRKFTVTTEKERVLEIGLEDLTAAWRGTLDW